MTSLDIRRALRLLLALALLVAGGLAWADPPGRVGRLAQASGTVWIYDAQQGEWAAVGVNRPITTGDRLATDNGARADIQIGSASLRLDGGAEMVVDRLDDQRVSLRLERGSAALRLRAADSVDDFEILAEDARYQPTRVGQYRIDVQDNVTTAQVWSGEMRFEATDSTLLLQPGSRYSFWRQDDRTHYDMVAVSGEDAFGAWVLAQDQREDRNASTRYVSPEMTGALDLDRYGRWDNHPEYGAVWYPVGVVAGWAPYRYGRWAWVAPWGWSWVDDAPWGFAPFHYGRWASWRGRWCWVPGRYVARPVYAPALVGWIGGSNFSVGVNVGARPAPPLIGWVPLGPRDPYVPRFHASPRHIWGINAPVGPWMPPPGTAPRPWGNRGVQGAVTVVPTSVLQDRVRVADRALPRAEPRWNTALPTQQPPLPRPERPDRPERPGLRGTMAGMPSALVPPPPSAARPVLPQPPAAPPGVAHAPPGVAVPQPRGVFTPPAAGAVAPQAPDGTGRAWPGGRERPQPPGVVATQPGAVSPQAPNGTARTWPGTRERPQPPGVVATQPGVVPQAPDGTVRTWPGGRERPQPPGVVATQPGAVSPQGPDGTVRTWPGPRERPQPPGAAVPPPGMVTAPRPPGVVTAEPGVVRPPLQRVPRDDSAPGVPPRFGRDQIPPSQRAHTPPDFQNARPAMPNVPGERVPPEAPRLPRQVPVAPPSAMAPPVPVQPRHVPEPPRPAMPAPAAMQPQVRVAPQPPVHAAPPVVQAPAPVAPGGGGGQGAGRAWPGHGGGRQGGGEGEGRFGGGPRER